MKTVITSTGNSITSTFDKRFGRGAWFCIYDSNTDEPTFIKNEFAEQQSGAGTKVSAKMVELGVTKVISGDFGPKAKELLDQFKIQMVVTQEESTVEEIIKKLKHKK